MPNQESKKSYKFFASKVFIRTFGCQMNTRDSEVICGLLQKEGYNITDELEKASIVIFNTCSVRQHAEDKVWSEIGRIAKTGSDPKKRGLTPFLPIIGVVGCMAQEHKEKIFARAPGVDFVVGPADIDKIPGILKKIGTVPKKQGQSLLLRKIWETDGDTRPDEIYHEGFYQEKDHAYVVISEGCSNFCSYCVVPYVRGQLHNRNHEDILKEIKEAISSGKKKITLLGQNVNAYNTDGVNFIKLIGLVGGIKGLDEFSFITSHPRDTSINLFKAMRDSEKLKKYLHMPVQSGSDRILKLMSRGYERNFYLDLVSNYRKIVKDGVLTTDIIVGFPSETEKDFQDTYDLVKDVGFNAAYIFKYSPRPDTEAAKLADDVPRAEKEKRHALILELQKKISKRKHD